MKLISEVEISNQEWLRHGTWEPSVNGLGAALSLTVARVAADIRIKVADVGKTHLQRVAFGSLEIIFLTELKHLSWALREHRTEELTGEGPRALSACEWYRRHVQRREGF